MRTNQDHTFCHNFAEICQNVTSFHVYFTSCQVLSRLKFCHVVSFQVASRHWHVTFLRMSRHIIVVSRSFTTLMSCTSNFNGHVDFYATNCQVSCIVHFRHSHLAHSLSCHVGLRHHVSKKVLRHTSCQRHVTSSHVHFEIILRHFFYMLQQVMS